jgi:hypothetical protein
MGDSRPVGAQTVHSTWLTKLIGVNSVAEGDEEERGRGRAPTRGRLGAPGDPLHLPEGPLEA